MIRAQGVRMSRLLVTFALMGTLMVALTGCQSGKEAGRSGVESGFVDVNGGRLFYETRGAGDPVIFSHGGFGDRRMWDSQFGVFAKHYRVIRYDHRGFGRSSKPTAAYSPAADLLAVMDALRVERAHIVGNSMGGSLALDFALIHPGRINKLVIVANGANGYAFEGPDIDYSGSVFRTAAREGAEQAAQMWLRHTMIAPTLENPSTAPLLRAMITENDSIFRMRYWPIEGLQPVAFDRLGSIREPVLFVVGDRDAASIRGGARASADRIDGAAWVEIANAGHLLQMDQPEAFNRVVDRFLRGR
jgi:3-oxoadipate enol-lactonase